ncbi:unnamed protein product [Camellia sinensis]
MQEERKPEGKGSVMRHGIGIRRRVDDGRLRIVDFDYRCRALEAVMAERESCSRDSSVRALSVEETVEESMTSGVDPLTVSIYQMDLDRTQFLLRSYIRIRLQKIEKYMAHIHKTTELWNRLSKQEQKYAQRCIEDLKEHFEKSVLSKLPDCYKSSLKQSVISEEDGMVREPQLDTYVICRAKRSLGAFQLDDSMA